MKKLSACLRNEEGATAIEYGLIAGIVAVIIVAAVGLFGDAITDTFTYIAGEMQPPA
jgi:pilus assembly protein Flp/PilA